MRSVYFCLIRSASAFLFSNGCSSLNLDFMAANESERDNQKAAGLPGTADQVEGEKADCYVACMCYGWE